MAKLEKFEIELPEDSLDSDREFLDMVEDPSYGSVTSDRPQFVTNLEGNEDENSSFFNVRDLWSPVTYKILQMNGDESTNNMTTESPTHVIPSGEFYIINNPVEVFSSDTRKKPIKRQPLQAKAVTAKKRDDKRRATHNEVERRRRDKINSWITKIADMIPNCGQQDTASKGGILAKACDHIADLNTKIKEFEHVEKDNAKLIQELVRLKKELSEVRRENSSMRIELDNCIVANLQRSKGQKS